MKMRSIIKKLFRHYFFIQLTLLAVPAFAYDSSLHILFAEKIDHLYVELPIVQKLRFDSIKPALQNIEQDNHSSSHTDLSSLDATKYYQDEVARVLEEHVDLRRISRGVMGGYYSQSTLQQRENFYQKIRSDLVKICSKGLRKVDFKKITKPEVASPRKDSKKNVVTLAVTSKNGNKYSFLISTSMKRDALTKKDKVQVTNISVGGLNLGVMLKHQFTASVIFSGGNIDKAIQEWAPITL